MKRYLLALFVLFSLAPAAFGQITVPGADGSDGGFNPTANVQVDLSLAPTGTWDGPNSSPGSGVYDPDKWAVVFRYSDVNIPSNVTVTFKNHPSRAPVVWLVSGDVSVNGTVSLNGASGNLQTFSEPAAGGFRGGRNLFSSLDPGSAGLGPGGGRTAGSGAGSYGSAGSGNSGPVYGNAQALPLIGGSGAARGISGDNCGSAWLPGGAGGGALLIACQNVVIVGGQIRADGGNGLLGGPCGAPLSPGGSGGTVRIIAQEVSGAGGIRALGGTSGGGFGRIRIEADSVTMADPGIPIASIAVPGTTATLWPSSTASSISISLIGGEPVPADPRSSFSFGSQDLSLNTPNPVVVRLQATNVPTTWTIQVRVVPFSGQDFTRNATLISGDFSSSIWETDTSGPGAIVLPNGFSAIQARAFQP